MGDKFEIWISGSAGEKGWDSPRVATQSEPEFKPANSSSLWNVD